MATTIQNIELPKKPRARDTSGNNNHGKIYSGRGLEFDGVADYLTAAANPDLILGKTSHTLTAWFKTDRISSDYDYIVAIGNNAIDKMSSIGVQQGKLFASRYSNSELTTNAHVDIGTWYRFTAVITEGETYNTIDFYLNGVFVEQKTSSTAYSVEVGKLSVGVHLANAINFTGAISDVQVWDKAWTAADVAYDYANPESLALNASGTALTESNLKVWYPMQDGHRGQQSHILDGANTGPVDEKIVNGDFSAGSASWTDEGHNAAPPLDVATFSANGLTITTLNGDGNNNRVSQPGVAYSGKSYKVTYTIDSANLTGSNSLQYYNGTAYVTIPTAITGVPQTFIFTSTSVSGVLNIRVVTSNGSTTDFVTISNISIKAINDKHHATTVFLGDEMIADAKNRTGFGSSDWAAHNIAGGNVTVVSDKLQVVTETDAVPEGAKLGPTKFTDLVAGRTYRVSVDLQQTGGATTPSMKIELGSTETSPFTISDSSVTYTKDIVAADDDNLIIYSNSSSSSTTFTIDNVSIKEVGVASGWTDADQQLHIPQTALQSYNELAWFDGEADYVDINPTTAIWNASDGEWNSVSCWVNETGLDSGIFYWSATFNPGLYVKISGSNHWVGYNTANGELFGISIASTSIVNKWNHWVMNFKRNSNSDDTVISGSDVELFLNGVKQTLSYLSGSNSNGCETTATQNIDLMRAGTSYYTQGVITETSVWKDQLTDAEVLELFNDGKALDALTHSNTNLSAYWRNNGLSAWTNLVDPGTNDGTPTSITETILIPEGVDATRDSQGFLMNRARSTSSLNFPVDKSSQTPSLDTGSYVEVGDHSGLTFGTGNFSMECWVKPSYRSKGSSSLNTIFTLGGQINDSDSAGLCTSSGSILAYIGGVSMSEGYSSNNWHHVVATREGLGSGEMKLYVNGAEEATGTSVNGTDKSTNINNAHNITIGAEDNRTRGYEEAVDSIKVYNRALDETEVLRNYKATKGSHRN